MKELLYVISPNDTSADLKDCFNNYLADKKVDNLLKLLVKITQNELYKLNLGNLNLSFKKILSGGSYKDGNIVLNIKYLKKAKKQDILVKVINTILHEVCHMKTEQTNNQIITSKKNLDSYCPPYYMENIWTLLNNICSDDEVAFAGSYYFYFKNKNEFISRKYAHYGTFEYINRYCPNLNSDAETFEEKEKMLLHNAYKTYPLLMYNIDVINNYIEKYQDWVLNHLDTVKASEIEIFIASLDILNSNERKKQIVNACLKSNNINNITKILKTPMVKLSYNDYINLSKNFNINLKDIVYVQDYTNDKCI